MAYAPFKKVNFHHSTKGAEAANKITKTKAPATVNSIPRATGVYHEGLLPENEKNPQQSCGCGGGEFYLDDRFFLGAAAGLALYRLIVALVCWSDPDRSITHCMWCHKNDCPRFKRRQPKDHSS